MMTQSMHLLELPEQRIAYAEAGERRSARPPLVLLHGGAVDHRMWFPQLHAFPERRTIVPDARGHGGSSDPDGPYRLADDVAALLDALDIERAVLVGISMGGGTAVDVALEHPARVAGLVVSGTGTSEPEFTDPWSVSMFAEWAEVAGRGDLEGWLRVFMGFAVGPHRSREDLDPELGELVETMVRETIEQHVPVGPDGVPNPPTPVPVTQTWERLGGIEVPVLALPGALDGADNLALGRRLAAEVPHGEYLEIPGAGHYPNLEDPAGFNAALGDFLARHEM